MYSYTVERIKSEARHELSGIDEELLSKFWDYLHTVFQVWKLEHGERNPTPPAGLLSPARPIPFDTAEPWECANLLHPCPAALAMKLLHESCAPFMTMVDKTGLRKALAMAIIKSDDAGAGGLIDAFEAMLADKNIVIGLRAGFDAGAKDAASAAGKKAINDRHDKPGASRDLARQIQDIWKSGRFSTRNCCADEEWESLGFGSLKTARNALINTPDPEPWPAKEK